MEGPNLRSLLGTPDQGVEDEPRSGTPARGRSRGVWILAIANLLLAVAAVCALRFISGAQEYASRNSSDIGSELEAALAGLFVMRIGCYVLAAGFLLCALADISLKRIGYTLQFLWAILLCLTLVGLPYGLPVLIFLFRRSTRERYSPAVPAD